jgi:hypothetical protein
MGMIREASPEGAFIKYENDSWYEVSDRYAREKVGAWFRDCLSHKYKSSSKAKHARKMARRISGIIELDASEDIISFPANFQEELKKHELKKQGSESESDSDRRSSMDSSTSSMSVGAFYDVDDLCLIPLDF